MGGEFYFTHNPRSEVDEEEWQLALQLALVFLLQKRPWYGGSSPAPTVSTDMNDEYAFEFEDSVERSDGEPKSFRLTWAWNGNAIESKLGGRKRTDWTTVKNVCELICTFMPGKFALVVCDGFSGYGENNIFFDGLGGGKYHKLNWEYWPWGDVPNPRGESIPSVGMNKERMKVLIARAGISFRGTELVSADVSSLGDSADVSSLDEDHAINNEPLCTERAEDSHSRPEKSSGHFEIGDVVLLVGLKSKAGQRLNGCTGQITQTIEKTNRFGVELHGALGSKSIQAGNLILTDSFKDTQHHESSPVVDLVETKASGSMTGGKSVDDGPRVRLLKFSRSPPALGQALLEAIELQALRKDLQANGLSVELPSGAKMFVRPEHYKPAMDAMRLLGIRLYPDHVIVDPDIEGVILGIVMELRGRNFVYPKQKEVVPIGLVSSAIESGTRLCVSRTFINIPIQNTSSDSAAQRTASTTDANDRKGANPRRRKNRSKA